MEKDVFVRVDKIGRRAFITVKLTSRVPGTFVVDPIIFVATVTDCRCLGVMWERGQVKVFGEVATVASMTRK